MAQVARAVAVVPMVRALTAPMSMDTAAAAASGPSIQRMRTAVSAQLQSGQVIVDLATAAKELLENALDAGATTIVIALRQYGALALEARDDGRGIARANHAGLALKHWTSKLTEFDQLGSVESFGFRGEALSSLAAMGELRVCTRCAEDELGTALVFDHAGVLVDQKAASRTIGTTVTLENLFSTLPVRHKVFRQHLKKEYAKMVNVLQSYAMVSTGVRIQVYNTVVKEATTTATNNRDDAASANSGGGTRTLVLSTQGSLEMKELICNVFGTKQIATLQEVSVNLESNDEFKLKAASPTVHSATPPAVAPAADSAAAASSSTATLTAASPSPTPAAATSPYRIIGFVSKLDTKCGRSATDRQYLFINNRPVDLPRLAKLINEAYRACNAQSSYPVFVLNLVLPAQSYDVNITPNKREIMVHDEAALFGLVRAAFVKMFEPTMSTYKVKSLAEFGITSGQIARPQQSQGSSQSSSQDEDELMDEDAPITIGQGLDDASREMSLFLSPDQVLGKCSPSSSSPPPRRALPPHSPSSLGQSSLLFTKRATPSPPSPATTYTRVLPSDVKTSTKVEVRAMTTTMPPPQLPIMRHQSTPAASSPAFASSASASASPLAAPPTAVRSANSFFGSFARGGASVSAPKLEAPSSPTPASERACKRQRTSSIDGGPPNGPLSFNRQATVVISHSPPIDLVDDSSPEVIEVAPRVTSIDAAADDEERAAAMFDDTDIGVQYQTRTVRRKIHMDMSTLEQYYASHALPPDDSNNATAASSLLDRASTLLSPSIAASSFSPLGVISSSSSSAVPRVLSDESMKRVVEKDDFRQMEIIGQFNLGFIIAKRNEDLFIIDQHASDEKYRFELLQATTVMNAQPLLNPLPLELSPAMEITVCEHLDVFRKNGFDIEVREDEGQDEATAHDHTQMASGSHRRIRVRTLPFSKNITFGAGDIHELAALLAEAPGSMVRLPKVTAMFASRACRSSVMIGTALTNSKMTTIVRHMGDIEHPWACPHGRPTLSHLADLRQFASLSSSSPIPVTPFAPTASQLRTPGSYEDEDEDYTPRMMPAAAAAASSSSCCARSH